MAHFSYGYFGAVTSVPGINSITVYVKVGTATKGFPGRVYYDSSITVPTLKWAVTSFGLSTIASIYYPTGYAVSAAPLNLTANGLPKNGEVLQLPGLGAPIAAPAPSPILKVLPPTPTAPAPVAPIPMADTGKTTIIDTAAGPTSVKVVQALVPAPMLISPTPGAAPVMVVPTGSVLPSVPAPTGPVPSNLPAMPARVQPRAPRLVDDDSGFPPGMYDRETYFPPQIFPRRVPQATNVSGGARRAMTAAADEEFDVQDIFIGGGRADEEGRPFPMVRPAQTGARSPSPSGFVPVRPALPQTQRARAETDGTVLVKVPSADPRTKELRPNPAPAGGGRLVGVAAGAGAGFLVGGPAGAAVGAIATLLLGRK